MKEMGLKRSSIKHKYCLDPDRWNWALPNGRS